MGCKKQNSPAKMIKMAIFKLLVLSYMHTTQFIRSILSIGVGL